MIAGVDVSTMKYLLKLRLGKISKCHEAKNHQQSGFSFLFPDCNHSHVKTEKRKNLHFQK